MLVKIVEYLSIQFVIQLLSCEIQLLPWLPVLTILVCVEWLANELSMKVGIANTHVYSPVLVFMVRTVRI